MVAYFNLGLVRKDLKDIETAIEHFSSAHTIAENLVRSEPTNMQHQRELNMIKERLEKLRSLSK
jgi:hypothetical protein